METGSVFCVEECLEWLWWLNAAATMENQRDKFRCNLRFLC